MRTDSIREGPYKYPELPLPDEEPVDYKSNYLVYRNGYVFSKYYKRFLAFRPNNHGYLRVWINNKDEYVHRIVAACFVPNPKGYREVNHIDGNKQNNNAENLEWCSRSYNNKHAFVTGLRKYLELIEMARCEKAIAGRRKRRIYSDEQARQIKTLIRQGYSDSQIVKTVGGSHGAVYSIRKGQTYTEIKENGYCD